MARWYASPSPGARDDVRGRGPGPGAPDQSPPDDPDRDVRGAFVAQVPERAAPTGEAFGDADRPALAWLAYSQHDDHWNVDGFTGAHGVIGRHPGHPVGDQLPGPEAARTTMRGRPGAWDSGYTRGG